MGKSLVGKKEITEYARRGWRTVAIWIKQDSFPAAKIEGKWESHTDLIDAWKRQRLESKLPPN